jgi:hypothetical protein
VALVFGNDCIEVDASLAGRRGGLRAFAREAESRWDLKSNTFSFVGALGKVDSMHALQSEMMASSNGLCKIEVHENAEAKMMRKVHAAVKASEDRILAKLEDSIGNLRKDLEQTDRKVSKVLAPMVQCLALEHMELHSKIGQVSAGACEDKLVVIKEDMNRLASLAPMVQCLALEQMELHSKMKQFASEDCEDELEVIEQDMDKLGSLAATEELDMLLRGSKSLESLEKELQQDCTLQAAQDLHRAVQDDLDHIKMEVLTLEQSQTLPTQSTTASIPQQDKPKKLEQAPQMTEHAASFPLTTDAWLPLPQAPGAGFYYSNKSRVPFMGTEDVVTMPQRLGAPRRYSTGWTWGSRSMPTLPPL